MRHSNLGRWFAGMAVVVLVVTGCAKGSGATETPAASTAGGGTASSQPSTAPGASASAAVAQATCQGAGDKGDVKMMINQWVGAEANVAVAQCLLQQMGYKVETSTLAEQPAWQGFDTGEVDVILENWGHPDLEKHYITDTKLASRASSAGTSRAGCSTSTRTWPTGTT
jgi:glycine betaine/proline transport system substrate-binding protein